MRQKLLKAADQLIDFLTSMSIASFAVTDSESTRFLTLTLKASPDAAMVAKISAELEFETHIFKLLNDSF